MRHAFKQLSSYISNKRSGKKDLIINGFVNVIPLINEHRMQEKIWISNIFVWIHANKICHGNFTKKERKRKETQSGQGRTERGNERQKLTERQKGDYTETWIETEEDGKNKTGKKFNKVTGRQRIKSEILNETIRDIGQLFPSKWKTSNSSG